MTYTKQTLQQDLAAMGLTGTETILIHSSMKSMEFELCQQGFALLALVPIWLYRGRQGCHSKPFQYACYAFYPVHMLVLVLALNFVNR